MIDRLSHIVGGWLILIGSVGIVMGIVVASHGLRGFADVAEFLALLLVCVGQIVCGWRLAE